MIKLCYCKLHADEFAVRNDMAITPSQMQNLTNAGRAVSIASLEGMSYYDNIDDFTGMPLENVRGIDENTLWEKSQESKEKIKAFRREQKKKGSYDGKQEGGMNHAESR